LPYLYQHDVLESYFDWQETGLLLALLKHTARYNIGACLSALHHDMTSELQEILDDYHPEAPNREGLRPASSAGQFPSSMWLEIAEA
jgi:hypothetical protein